MFFHPGHWWEKIRAINVAWSDRLLWHFASQVLNTGFQSIMESVSNHKAPEGLLIFQ